MSTILNLLNETQAMGNSIVMNRTDAGHMKVIGQNAPDEIPEASTFSDLVRQGLNAANQDQLDSTELFTKMVTQPDSVEVHDVSIAMAKANMSLQMTKSIVDGAVQAYKDIINMR